MALVIGALATLGLWRVCYVAYRAASELIERARASVRACIRRFQRSRKAPKAIKVDPQAQANMALAMAMAALAQAIQGRSQGRNP